tara:strand:+ start:407 stop:745 length:339 start_codon:yes stop_codon:yes gene_type:complete
MQRRGRVMDFLAIYSEAGMIGVVGAMFVFMVYSMNKRGNEQAEALQNLKIENKGQSETLENMEGMVIKLIGRWNQSDDKLDRKFDALNKEINDLDNQVSEIKGSLSRVNGKH